jgi:hypothetical protein
MNCLSGLEGCPNAELRSERNTYCCARAEEITQSAFGDLELFQAGDGHGLSAGRICTDCGYIGYSSGIGLHPRRRNGELCDVYGEVGPGIVAVEDVEELHKRVDLPSLADPKGAGDAQIGLEIRRAAKFVEAGVYAIHPDAATIVGVGDGDGAGALILRNAAQLEAPANREGAGEHKAMPDVFSGGAVVARAEGIELSRVRPALQAANAVDIIEKLAEQASPGLGLRELVIRGQAEVPHMALQMHHESVVAGATVGLKHIHIRHNACLIGGVARVRRRDGGREQIDAARIREGAIPVIPLDMHIVRAGQPPFIESVLCTAGDLNGVGRLVIGTDEIARRACLQAIRLRRAHKSLGRR